MAFLTLIDLANQDLLVLEEMEWNGMKYDLELSQRLGDELVKVSLELDRELRSHYPDIPYNPNSPEHLSAMLYGGSIQVPCREAYEFRYKDGRVKIKERWGKKEYILPRIVEPLKDTKGAAKDKDVWSVAEDVLRSLKPRGKAKRIIELILEISLTTTKIERYYHGIPKKYVEKGWQNQIIHGQLNQCVARTGRLSSSDPNMQNMDGVAKQCFVSRF